MANELQADFGLSGQTVYFTVRSSTGTIWNGASLVSYVSANYSTYVVAGAEQGTSAVYVGTMPAVPAGTYSIVAKQQVGGSAAESDPSIADGSLTWDGTLVPGYPPNQSSLAIASGTGTVSLAATPPTAAQIATAVLTDTNSGDLGTSGSLGKVAVTQLGTAFGAAGSSTYTVAALQNAPGGGSSTVTVGAYATGKDPATLVLGAAAASWDTSGTIGQKINSAGSAGDPLTNPVPGNYASGTAGAALGRIGSGQITTVSSVAQAGNVSVVYDCDYFAADDEAILFTNSGGNWPNLTSATVTFGVDSSALEVFGSCLNPGQPTQTVQFELSSSTTSFLPPSSYSFSVVATLVDGHRIPLVQGTYSVTGVDA